MMAYSAIPHDGTAGAGAGDPALEYPARLEAGWRGPRWLRARAFAALGRHDEGERELTVLVALAPSLAAAWRLLGRTLATHGGALDAERADEALRHALALEPAASDLWWVRAQVALRRGRVRSPAPAWHSPSAATTRSGCSVFTRSDRSS